MARIPAPVSGYELAEIDGKALLFFHGRASLHRLNASAALIWKLCDGTRTVADIVELISDAFPDADIAEDVCVAIDGLVGEGALRWSQGTDRT